MGSIRFRAGAGMSGFALMVGLVGTMGTAPAAWAGTPVVSTPNVVVANLPKSLSALASGVLVQPEASNGNAVVEGYELSAQIAPINYAGTSGPGSYSYTWLSCPARGVPDTSCATASTSGTVKGDPGGGNSAYTATANDAMRYMRFSLTVTPSGTWDSARTVTSDPTKDIFVMPGPITGAQPQVAPYQGLGTTGVATLKAWTLPSTAVFRVRDVAVWACTSATAGQTAGRDFAPDTAGCTTLTLTSNPSSTPDGVALTFLIPAGASGQYLLVSDTITVASGASALLSAWVVRSATAPLPGQQAVTPTPVPAGAPSIAVAALGSVKPGGTFAVSIAVSPTSSSGTATVRLVTRGKKPTTVQTLKAIRVTAGQGASTTTISTKVRPGTYNLVVRYSDTSTGMATSRTKAVKVS